MDTPRYIVVHEPTNTEEGNKQKQFTIPCQNKEEAFLQSIAISDTSTNIHIYQLVEMNIEVTHYEEE